MKRVLKTAIPTTLALLAALLLATNVMGLTRLLASAESWSPKALNGARIEWSPPTLADVDGDGDREIVVGGSDGKVWVVRPDDGAVLWSYTAPSRIDASPAVGDLDNDGDAEVVVGFGKNPLDGGSGGVLALDHNGNLLGGWPQYTLDVSGDGVSDGVHSSPALGDLDNDGDMEIVVGSFDKRIYAWHHNGSSVSGFPRTTGNVVDSIWSSPALADIDRDSHLEIIIGTDVGKVWSGGCPYALPPGWHSGYCGGSLWVFNHDGTVLDGFPVYVWEIIQSSPAIADLDEDGWLDIIVGTGTFYYNYNGNTLGHRVYAWDHNGDPLPGWDGGSPVTYAPSGSPAVGDIDEDGHLEVVIGTQNRDSDSNQDGYIYALNHDGTELWHVRPTDHLGKPARLGSPMLADYDQDGQLEVLFNIQWEIAVVEGASGNQSSDYFAMNFIAYGPPAVADIDGDRRVEVVAAGGTSNGDKAAIYVWQQDNTWTNTPSLAWPMFHQNARNTGVLPWIGVYPESIVVMHQYGDTTSPERSLQLDSTERGLEWSALATPPSPVSVSPGSGAFPEDTSLNVTIDASSYTTGTHDLGEVVVSAVVPSNVYGSPVRVPVTLIVGDISNVFLPLVLKQGP